MELNRSVHSANNTPTFWDVLCSPDSLQSNCLHLLAGAVKDKTLHPVVKSDKLKRQTLLCFIISEYKTDSSMIKAQYECKIIAGVGKK